MTDVPQFNLTANNIDYDSDEALQEAVEKVGGKFFDTPGNFDLTIVAADFHKNKDTGSIYCKGDNSWFNVQLTFRGSDEKEINHWLQIPTTSITFGEKKTLAVFRKLQQFFFGIGEAVTINSLNGLLQKYFAKPEKLVGQKVNADLGYEGPYVAKSAESDDFVVMVKGKPMQEDGADVKLPDRASAVQYAKSQGIEPSFIRILKFTAKKPAKLKKASNSDW